MKYVYQLRGEPLEDIYFSSLNKAIAYCRRNDKVYHPVVGNIVNQLHDGHGVWWSIYRHNVK